MNSQIEAWRVQQYAANVYQLSQQKGSRFAPVVRKETFTGKSEFFDRLGLATAAIKSGRNDDSPDNDIAHTRRMVVSSIYHWGTLVDRNDKLQNIHSPENEYAVAARNALGRSMDTLILQKLLSSAATGEDGSSTTSLGNTNKVVSVSSGILSRLNIQALRKAAYLLNAAEAEGQRYLAITSYGLESLLSQTEVASADYNTVKALVQGELNTFLGFNIIRTELLGLCSVNSGSFTFDTTTGLYAASGGATLSAASNYATAKSSIAFVGDGLVLGMREGAIGRVEERSDKSFSTQVYASMDFGAVRMEENKVVEICALEGV